MRSWDDGMIKAMVIPIRTKRNIRVNLGQRIFLVGNTNSKSGSPEGPNRRSTDCVNG